MPTPFADFFVKIARDDAALKRFVADPQGDPEASALTPEQRTALASGIWQNIQDLLFKENRGAQTAVDAALAAANVPAAIGWNMVVVIDRINLQKAAKP